MSDDDNAVRVDHALARAWQVSGLDEALQVIVEGASKVAGFGAAALNVIRENDEFEIVAVAGDQPGIPELIGTRTPRSQFEQELASAQDWGLLKFVPHDRLSVNVAPVWVPDFVPLDGAGAWHPLDLLLAPLCDADGAWLGVLSVDLPEDGRRPDAERRRVLTLYAEQAAHALERALEREQLNEKVRLTVAARRIIRSAGARLDLDQLLERVEPTILEAFDAQGMWLHIFADLTDPGDMATPAIDTGTTQVPANLTALTERVALRAWREQRTAVFSRTRSTDLLDAREADTLLDYLEEETVQSSLMLVPLGVGPHCAGNLVLTRDGNHGLWNSAEREAALDIGHDLGGAILTARNFERDQRVVDKLRAVDRYKSQLIATVAHEFRNPLTTIVGHLELLEEGRRSTGEPEDPSFAAIARGAERLTTLVDQLLELRRVTEPTKPDKVELVDLSQRVRDSIDLLAVQARSRSHQLTATYAAEPILVAGSADELDTVCLNLLSNALKYTVDGGTIRVEVFVEGAEGVIRFIDNGLGINPADKARLFEEFFRSHNSEALNRPGTGLGLAIVARVLERHGGSISVNSELGRGSEFVVRLPLAP